MSLDIVGPYKVSVDMMEIHDPETDAYWRLKRERGVWRFAGPGREWSAGYAKNLAIARCKEAIKVSRGEPVQAKPEPKPGARPTADERRYMDRVKALGCAVADEHCDGPVEIHHVRLVPGQRRKHKQVVPLCSAHHRTGGHGVAFHAGQEAWQDRYGEIVEVLALVRFAMAHIALQEAEA